jgi:3-hydroxyisobutyrate dehydrogenase-like beta-hydroxyacid dehydrogenase
MAIDTSALFNQRIIQSIGFIGYGEVGKTFAAALKPQTSQGVAWVGAWDVLFDEMRDLPDAEMERAEAVAKYERQHARDRGIAAAGSAKQLCETATLIISCVTASNTLAVAEEVAQHIQRGSYFLDFNSASPATKQACAKAIEAAGGHYVEAGVMTSVPPYGIKTPMLLGGAHAEKLAVALTPLGFDAKMVSDKLGVASAIKMCRSVMIKGLEALVMESYNTARHYGVEDFVIPTLVETFPEIDWERQGDYLFSRVIQHGKRRSEEMVESAATVREAGLEPLMASAIAAKQASVAKLKAQGVFAALGKDYGWREAADLINTASGFPRSRE